MGCGTIYLALGSWRISQRRVLARGVSVVETLGVTTVLCVDKTGTMTLNRVPVSALFADGELFSVTGNNREHLPEKFHELAEFGILPGRKDP